ncbi:MAG: hypothetical protein H5T63_10665, partial [Chloroflexi bacterium]|nr:hypothetical protein [Chloroflexota bacterium]
MSTFHELVAYTISTIQPQIKLLAQQEQEAKKSKNKDARKRAEEQISRIRAEILKVADPSIVYLYLAGTQKADSDGFRLAWQKDFLSNPDRPSRQLQNWEL